MVPETKLEQSRRFSTKRLKQFFPYTKSIVYSTTYKTSQISKGNAEEFPDLKPLDTASPGDSAYDTKGSKPRKASVDGQDSNGKLMSPLMASTEEITSNEYVQ